MSIHPQPRRERWREPVLIAGLLAFVLLDARDGLSGPRAVAARRSIDGAPRCPRARGRRGPAALPRVRGGPRARGDAPYVARRATRSTWPARATSTSCPAGRTRRRWWRRATPSCEPATSARWPPPSRRRRAGGSARIGGGRLGRGRRRRRSRRRAPATTSRACSTLFRTRAASHIDASPAALRRAARCARTGRGRRRRCLEAAPARVTEIATTVLSVFAPRNGEEIGPHPGARRHAPGRHSHHPPPPRAGRAARPPVGARRQGGPARRAARRRTSRSRAGARSSTRCS